MKPTTAKYPCGNQKQLSMSTGNTKRNFASTQADVPGNPFQSTVSRQRNQNFGSATPNVFGKRNSESKSSTSHISPRALDKESEGRNRPLGAADGTPGRIKSNLPFDQTKQKVFSKTTKKIPAQLKVWKEMMQNGETLLRKRKGCIVLSRAQRALNLLDKDVQLGRPKFLTVCQRRHRRSQI
jgi:hypothetical protein